VYSQPKRDEEEDGTEEEEYWEGGEEMRILGREGRGEEGRI
jgi:hypothetical protein